MFRLFSLLFLQNVSFDKHISCNLYEIDRKKLPNPNKK